MYVCGFTERHSTAKYEGDLVMFVDLVTFVTNKIIKNKSFNYSPK